MVLSIRKAVEDDLSHLARMNKKLIEDEGSRNPMNLEQLQERMTGWLRGEYQIEIFENEDNVIVGYAVFEIRKDDFDSGDSYVYLRQLFIERGHRSKGYGSECVKLLISSVFPKGVRVEIDVLQSNPRGRDFWSKVGFDPYFSRMRKNPVEEERY